MQKEFMEYQEPKELEEKDKNKLYVILFIGVVSVVSILYYFFVCKDNPLKVDYLCNNIEPISYGILAVCIFLFLSIFFERRKNGTEEKEHFYTD